MRTVKEIIDRWDPIELLCHAPKDEYDNESAQIERLAGQSPSIDRLAQVIFAVFIQAFGAETFKHSAGRLRRHCRADFEQHRIEENYAKWQRIFAALFC